MIAAKNFGDFLRGIVRHIFSEGRSKDALQVSDGEQAFHHCGVRRKHDGVLILSHRVVTFRFEHTYHAKRYFAETDNLSHGITTVREKVIYDCLSDNAYFGRALYIGFGKHLSIFDSELTDVEIFCSSSVDGGRVVIVSGDELSGRRYVGTNSRQEICLIA